MGQMSFASPAPVLAERNTRPTSNRHRTGLLSFSLMTTDTRSRLFIIAFVSTCTQMGLLRGMALR